MSVHVRETGKGRRCDVKLRDRDGVMHTKTFRTKREAVDYEADQRAQLSAGAFIAPRASATTVEDLATRWLAAGTKRDSSRARDRSIVQTHLLPGLGPKRAIGTVTRADCQALVDRWAAAGLAPRRPEARRSKSTAASSRPDRSTAPPDSSTSARTLR